LALWSRQGAVVGGDRSMDGGSSPAAGIAVTFEIRWRREEKQNLE
jgi:hypothetical protein